MKRCFADFNAMDADGTVRMNLPGCVADIRRTGAAAGETVLLSDGELLVEGRLEWTAGRGFFAVPDRDTLIHLDEQPSATGASE